MLGAKKLDLISLVGCTLHDCTTLMNSSRVWYTFGTAWTRPSLTVQLMSGVAVFVLVCGQRVDTLNKC